MLHDFKTRVSLNVILKYVKSCLEEILHLSSELENDHTATWGALVRHVVQDLSHTPSFYFFPTNPAGFLK